MRRLLTAAFALALAAAPALAAGVGDKAPAFDVKETINIPSLTTADLDGRVVLVEVFRTW